VGLEDADNVISSIVDTFNFSERAAFRERAWVMLKHVDYLVTTSASVIGMVSPNLVSAYR